MDVKKYEAFLDKRYIKELGRVKKVVGLTMESFGPDVVLDDVCRVTSIDHKVETRAEVIGFKDDYVLLMPYEEIGGIGVGSYVENLGVKVSVRVGDELLGKKLNGLGESMDGTPIRTSKTYPAEAAPHDP